MKKHSSSPLALAGDTQSGLLATVRLPDGFRPSTCLHRMLAVLTLAILALTASTALAAVRYWDGGTNDIAGDGNGGSSGGSGIWDTNIMNWDQGAALPHTNWVNEAGDEPSFGGTPGTVTLGADINVVGTLNINSGTAAAPYIIAGGSGPYTLTVSNDATFGAGGYGIITAQIIGGTNRVTKAFGSGTLVLAGPTAFGAASNSVEAGTLVLSNSAALGTGNLTLFGGVLGLGNGNFNRSIGTGDNQFQINGGGFAAFGADRNVGIGTATWGSTVANRIVGTLTLGAADADATVTWTGNISFGGSTRTIQVDNGSAPVDAVISGRLVDNPGGLTKTGSGVLSLTASNTYSGVTTISGGVLKLDNTNAIPGGVSTNGTNGISLSGAGLVGLTADSGDFFRYYGTGTSNVTWTGSGGFAAYGGTRTAKFTNSAGTSINWSTTGFIGAGRNLVLSHASSDSTIVWQQAISLAGSPRIVQVNNGSAAIDAIMSGVIGGGTSGTANELVKTGSGTLALTGANSYWGPTTVSNGTLVVGDGSTSGRLSANSTSTFVATNATLAVNRSDAVAQATASSGLGNNAVISGEGAVAHIGTGTLTLSLSNSYSGGTYVSGSNLLTLAHSSAAGTGPINFASTSTGTAATFTLSGGINVTNPIVMDAANGRNSITTSGSGDSTLGGDITINNTATYDIVVQNSVVGTTLTLGGATPNSATITAPTFARTLSLRGNNGTAGALGILNSQINAPSATVNANNNALWTINSTGNTWAVTTFSGASSFVLGANNALATGSYLNFAASATGYLDLNGKNQTVAGLTVGNPTNGVYNITNGGGSDSILTLAGLAQDRTFNGSIIDGGAGKRISLVMNSSGFTQTLTNANAYTGDTTVSAGTLAIQVASIATNSTVSVAVGAQLSLGFSETNLVTGFVTNGVALAPGVYNAGNVGPFLAGTGSLQVPGAGPTPPTPENVTRTVSGGNLILGWTQSQWKLATGTNVTAITNIIPGATSPYTNSLNEAKRFYRLVYP